MHRNSKFLMGGAAALGALALAVGPASAAKEPPAPNKATLRIVGGTQFKPGHSVTDNQRFKSRSVTIKSGGTLKVVNKAKSDEPHTVTFVSKLPRSFAAFEQCMEKGDCGTAYRAHEVPEEGGHGPSGPPKNLFVDLDKDGGVNKVGESQFIAPPGAPSSSMKVTAKKGTNLKFLCLVHPWMQGKLNVR